MKIPKIIFFLILFIPFPFYPCYGYGQHSLLGISGVAVFVNNMSTELTDKELFLPEIEDTISKKLRNSGVTVYKQSEWLNKAGGAYLSINIVSSKFKRNDSYAIYINFEFYRTVMFMSNMLGKNEVANAETWSTGKLMSCEKNNLNSCIYDGISGLTDIFINQYVDVNKIDKEDQK